MKKRDFSDRATYESPAVTWLDIRVEQGFAVSIGASNKTEEDSDGSGSESLTEKDW